MMRLLVGLSLECPRLRWRMGYANPWLFSPPEHLFKSPAFGQPVK